MKRKLSFLCALCLSALTFCTASASAASGSISLLDALPETVGEFETTDVNGEEITQDIFQDYDLTLVNIFATWCGPCVNEIPELEQIYQDLGEGYNLNVIGIVMDTVNEKFEQTKATEDAVETAKLLAEKTGATYPFVIPDSTALNGRLKDVEAFPETFFVDSEGNIVGDVYVGARDYDQWADIIIAEMNRLKDDTE